MADKIFHSRLLELGNPKPCISGFDHSGFDAFNLDFFSDQSDDDGFCHIFACDRQRDFCIRVTTHFLDSFVQGKAFY